jgi:hypothetical protein
MTDQAARYLDATDAAQQLACIAWQAELTKRENAAKAGDWRDPIPLPLVCRMAREKAEAIEFVEVDIEVEE